MFKIGDEIVCIDIENNCADKHLEVGKEYTVSLEGDGTLVLEGVPHEWMVSRFVLASEYNKVEAVKEGYAQEVVKPIKSDGGSSEYYKLTVVRASDGAEFVCEVGDVIAALVGDNFQLGNVVKGARRMWCDAQGKGKDGIDMSYDRNKIHYFSGSSISNWATIYN